MATQADTLTLAAQVVDQFSAPLRDLTKQLKAFSGLQQDTNKRGKRDTDDHWKSYRNLSTQITETASATRKLLLPAVEALGVTSLATIGSIGGIATALKSLGQSAENLKYLREETGLTANQFRVFEVAGERVGIGVATTDAAIKKFAENLNQYKQGHGDFVKSLEVFRKRPDLMAWARSLAVMPAADALEAIRKKLQTLKGEEKALVERAYGLPEGFGRETNEMIADVKKNLGELSDADEAALQKMQANWHDLKESIEGAANAVSTKLAPWLGPVYKGLADIVSLNPKWAAFGASLAGMAASLGAIAGIRGLLGVGAAGAGVTGSIGGGVAGAARFGLTGAAAAALAATLYPQGLNEGEDERARQRKYGRDFGRGHRALMARAGHDGFHPISGAFADIAQGYRGEESIYKGTLKGSREGVIQAFQQLFRDRQAGGGITQAAYHPGEGGGAGTGGGGQDSGPGSTQGASEPPMGRGAAQRAILGGRVKEFAQTLREKLGGGIADYTPASDDTRADKNFNPGNIMAGKWAAAHGATGSSGTDEGHGVAVFPNARAGFAAMESLAQEKYRSGNVSADQLIAGPHGWTPGNHAAAANVARAMGIGPNDDLKLGEPGMMRKFQLGLAQQEGAPKLGSALRNAGAAPGVRGSAAAAASFAESMQGLKDHDAAGHAAITQYLRTGGAGMDPATTKWCGAFVEASLYKAGIAGPAGAAVATNWARWGSHVDPANARRGDVVVVLRGYRPGQLGGHVGLVTGAASGGQIPTIEGDVRAPGGGHMARAASQRIREGLEIRRAPGGLDANARKHFGPATVKHEGHAKVSVDFRGMPRGVKVAGKSEGIFNEVRLNRGRAAPIAEG